MIELLAGEWAVERTVRDDRGGGDGTFSGRARFERSGGGLLWTEQGELRTGAHAGPAGRTLAIVADAGGWLVEFADGRPFHRLDLRSGRCAVEHVCGADRYAGEYALRGRNALDVAWRVSGPGKDLTIASAYHRLSATAAAAGAAPWHG